MSPPPEALVERVRRRLAAKGWSASAVSVTEALRDEGLVLPEAAIVEVVSSLRTEIAGLGALAPVIAETGFGIAFARHWLQDRHLPEAV